MKTTHLVILIVVIILVIIAIAFCAFYFIRRKPKQQQLTEDIKPPTDEISSFFVPDFKEQLTESVEQNSIWKQIDNDSELILSVPEYVKPVSPQNQQPTRIELTNTNIYSDTVNEAKTSNVDDGQFVLYGEDVF